MCLATAMTGIGARGNHANTSIFADIALPQHSFSRPASGLAEPAFSTDPHSIIELVRQQLVQAEDSVPWTAVRKHWKGKRNSWRKAVKQALSVPELGKGIKEFKAALCGDSSAAVECSSNWQESLELCCQGQGTHLLLQGVWAELQPKVTDWLQSRSSPRKGAVVQDRVQRGISAMQQVFHSSNGCLDAMSQVPLEQICAYDVNTARSIKDKLCMERSTLISRHNSTPSSLAANVALNERAIGTAYLYADSEHDTSTSEEAGSDVTDMSDCDGDF